jgi:hypothetical protein
MLCTAANLQLLEPSYRLPKTARRERPKLPTMDIIEIQYQFKAPSGPSPVQTTSLCKAVSPTPCAHGDHSSTGQMARSALGAVKEGFYSLRGCPRCGFFSSPWLMVSASRSS